jgi:hypothetical protein
MAVPERITLDGIELNDGSPWTILEDPGFEFRPAPKKLNWVTSPLSDGAVLSGDEDHYENAEMVFAINCQPQASKDAALSKGHELTQKLQEARRSGGNLPLVWTPSESSGSWTFYVEEAEWEDLGLSKQGGWFDSAPSFTVRLTLRPFLYGAETLTKLGWSDSFFNAATLTGGRWRFDAGSGTLDVTSGSLVPNSDVLKRLYIPFTTTDATVTMRVRAPSTLTGFVSGALMKRLGASDYLRLVIFGTSIIIGKATTAGGLATLATGVFVPTVSTFYWLQARIVGDDVGLAIYSSAQNPLETDDATALGSVSHTLAGSDATTFGTDVRGQLGIYLDPPASVHAEATVTDYIVTEMDDVQSSQPLTEFEIPDVKGHVPAEGRLVVMQGGGSSQAHFEWGLEARDYNRTVVPPLILDSAAMVPSAGSQVTGTNKYDPDATGTNAIQSDALSPTTAVTVAFTNARFHTGTYKVKARVSSGAAGVRARLAYQVGVSRYIENPYVPPLVGGINQEIDLGTVIIPEAVLGTHVWSGRIDAYSPEVPGATLVIDYLMFIPQERYGVARAPLVPVTPTTFSVLDSFQQTSGALNGKALEIPTQNWATSGATGDFTVVDASNHVERTAVSDANLNTGRYALGGTTNYGAIQVQAEVTGAAVGVDDQSRLGVLARYVDANNWIIAVIQNYTAGVGLSDRARLKVFKRVAGTVTQLGSKDLKDGSYFITERMVVLSVDALGVWQAYAYNVGSRQSSTPLLSGFDTDLAAGGPLASGRVGLYDAYISASVRTRVFANFAAFASAQDVVMHPSRNLEVRADRTERESSGGGVWGRVPEYRGDRFLVPAAGDEGYVSRIAAKARRLNVDEGLADSGVPSSSPFLVSDPITVAVYLTPRYLHPPGIGD